MKQMIHLTLRANAGHWPLKEFESARWLWSRLRIVFPDSLGCVLMENHLHLVLSSSEAGRDARRLAFIGRGFARHVGRKGLWCRVRVPEPIADIHHLRRTIRYVLLNPCRAGIVADPLAWTWSSLRDVLGAVADPWVTRERLAEALGWRARGFSELFHGYVCGDERVASAARVPPVAAVPSAYPAFGLDPIAEAAVSALRVSTLELKRKSSARRLFCQLAAAVGQGRPTVLARYLGVNRGAPAVWMRRAARPSELAAGMLCLGDARLRVVAVPKLARVPGPLV